MSNFRIALLTMLTLATVWVGASEACTVFSISTPTTSLLANNEDFTKRGAIAA
jgi:hypothetical protein